MEGTERTTLPMLAPAVACTLAFMESSGYMDSVVRPDARPPASAARTSSFPGRDFRRGGPAHRPLGYNSGLGGSTLRVIV